MSTPGKAYHNNEQRQVVVISRIYECVFLGTAEKLSRPRKQGKCLVQEMLEQPLTESTEDLFVEQEETVLTSKENLTPVNEMKQLV